MMMEYNASENSGTKEREQNKKKSYERERFSGFLHEFFECFWAHQHSSRYYVCYAKKWHKWRASSAMYSTVSIHFHPKRIICEIHPTKRWNGKIKRKKETNKNSAEKFVVQINILITFWVSPVIKNQERERERLDWSKPKKTFCTKCVNMCLCVYGNANRINGRLIWLFSHFSDYLWHLTVHKPTSDSNVWHKKWKNDHNKDEMHGIKCSVHVFHSICRVFRSHTEKTKWAKKKWCVEKN